MTPEELLAGVAQPPPGGLAVALSGGPDSAVAGWLSTRLSTVAKAIHVHHGTAGADVMEEAAKKVAEKLGLPLETVAVDVPAEGSWEAAARNARWGALAAQIGPDETIVTGHHEDDLAETTLANLLRGAGASGLGAFAAERAGVWRPLRDAARHEVRSVADQLNLPYVDDPTNTDTTFSRNKLRHDVIPRLEEEFNPRLRSQLAQTARTLAADDAALEAVAHEPSLRQDAWGAWKVAAAPIVTAEPAVASRIVRHLLRAARPPYAGNSREVGRVLDVVHGEAAGYEIAGGVRIEIEGPWLVAHRGAVESPPGVDLPIPGDVQFGALEVAAAATSPLLLRRTSLVDSTVVGPSVELRGHVEADKIDIAAGTKPVRDVLAEAGVPARLRSAWPLAVAHARIVAVVGVRSAPWARGALGDEGTVELTARERQP